MAKKHKKQKPKILKEAEHTKCPESRTQQAWRYLKIFGTFWIVVSTALNIYLAYLTLRPDISIDYASHLIPKNLMGLPIKITNHSYLPIYNIKILFFNNISYGGIKLNVFHPAIDLCNELKPKDAIDYIYNNVQLNNMPTNLHSSGHILVVVRYKVPILHIILNKEQKFKIFNQSQDKRIRWMTTQ